MRTESGKLDEKPILVLKISRIKNKGCGSTKIPDGVLVSIKRLSDPEKGTLKRVRKVS